jgi:hypothetical protein
MSRTFGNTRARGRLVPRLKDKIENALNEGRILLLGGQVLIGAGFRTIFNDGFARLPQYAQAVQLASLWVMTVGLGILLLPPPYHFIVEAGENTKAFHELVNSILEWALLPFAVGIGVATWMIGQKLMTSTGASVVGGLVFILAVSMWYVLSLFRRKHRRDSSKEEPTKLTDKIKEALIEARMILPGAQALLGFQVANTFTNSFDHLPRTSQWLHFSSLLCTAVCTVFLMTPAAYHRIAEHGEDSEEFYNLSGRLLLSAMFWLGLGIATELWVVTRMISHSVSLSNAVAILSIALFFGVWFGYSAYKRQYGRS